MAPADTKFLVIGAGPAGLTTAVSLAERGFDNITVLEKSNQVGGKCLSFHDGDYTYDMGANLTTPRYKNLRALADDMGMVRQHTAARRVVSINSTELPVIGWFEAIAIRLLGEGYKFARWLTGIDQPGYLGLPDNAFVPFREWLRAHWLSRLEPLFEVLFTSYGYGEVMDLPAVYAMKFFDPIHFNTAIDVVLGHEVEGTEEFIGGFQLLWERVAECLNVRTGVQIVSLTPSALNGVCIEYYHDGIHYIEQYDQVIVGCPLQELDLLLPEHAPPHPFARIETFRYHVTVARCEGLPEVATYVAPYAMEINVDEPTVFYPPVCSEAGVFTFYAYADSVTTNQAIEKRIKQVVETLGGKVTEFLKHKEWRYFPHVKNNTKHWYELVELMQGQNSMWYAGEVLSFTLVEEVYRYSMDLADRIIASLGDEYAEYYE